MLLDTSAWVEYLLDTEKGRRVAEMLKSDSPIYVCPLTFAEISSWANRQERDPEPFIRKIKELSKSLELDEEMLILSGKIHVDQRKDNGKLSLIDAVIYASAAMHGLVLLTCDSDFAGLSNVEIL